MNYTNFGEEKHTKPINENHHRHVFPDETATFDEDFYVTNDSLPSLEEEYNILPPKNNSSVRSKRDLPEYFHNLTRKDQILELYSELEALQSQDIGEDNAAEQFDRIKILMNTLNNITRDDDTMSEQMSSFSSSEETMMKCKGVLVMLPIQPTLQCNEGSETEVSYAIDETDTYYIIVTNDNEVYVNDLNIKLELDKVVYNVREASDQCSNSTSCKLPFSFASDETVVLQKRLTENNTGWDDIYVLESECIPRTYVYLAFFIAAPLFLILFAFS